MKYTLIGILLLIITGLKSQDLEIPAFGSDTTFEVLSWNIEWFPKNGQTTADYVSEIIKDLDVDLIAMQELDKRNVFDQMIAGLEEYEGYHKSGYFACLAYIYNSKHIEVDTIYEILTTQPYWRPFPRSPMVMELFWNNQKYIVINNHFKCCGDEYLDKSDPWDEETRRYDASNLLEEYINDNFQNQRVILTGDLNDDIAESSSNNVFTAFISKPDKYMFVDMEIAGGPITNWSYPTWPSHLDHVLITNSLFEDFSNIGSDIQTVKLDQYFNSWNQYNALISDHRPIGIKIYSESNLGDVELNQGQNNIRIFPVPAIESLNIEILNNYKTNGILSVYSSFGVKMNDLEINKTQNSYIIETKAYPTGVYFIHFKVDEEMVYRERFIITR